MNNISVSSHFVVAALSGAKAKGYDIEAILREAGIAPEVLDNPRARVSGSEFTALIQQTWNKLQDEFMGFTRRRSKPGTFATMCHLVIHCNTLESALRRSCTFYGLFDDTVALELVQDGEQARLQLAASPDCQDPYHFLQESLLVIWHRFACWLVGQQIILDQAFFDYPAPHHVREYKHLFNCPLEFDCPRTGISFNRRYLSLPVIRDEQALKKFLISSPADLLAKPDDSNTYTARIRALIGRDFNHSLPDFERIAEQLNLSPQTLRRRLRAENTSYQQIKDLLRRDLAIYHLSRNELSINEIALRVGFTEPSTFHRAFKKWTGMTPGAYRSGEGQFRS